MSYDFLKLNFNIDEARKAISVPARTSLAFVWSDTEQGIAFWQTYADREGDNAHNERARTILQHMIDEAQRQREGKQP